MKTKFIFSLKICALCSILIIELLGCKNLKKDNIINSTDNLGTEDSLLILNSKIKYLLPSPDEIMTVIFKEKINYKSEIVSNPNSKNNIINSNFQALMLGVYISDFSYTLLYNDFNKSSKYLEAIRELSEKLGISNIFDKLFFKRIENSLGNIDSLKAIYQNFSENSFNLIAESGNEELLSLIAMGSSIESIYLGYTSFKDEPINQSLKPFFIEQRVIFDNFFQNYNNYNFNKKDLALFNNDLNSFYSHFKLNIWLIIDKNKVSKSDSIMSVEVKYIVKTNSDNINDLGKSIYMLRENLINHKY